MPREEKQGRRTFLDEGLTPAPPDGSPAKRAPAGRRSLVTRWFAAVDPTASPPAPPRRPSPIAAVPLLVAAVLAGALFPAGVLRVLVPFVLALAAAAIVRRWVRSAPGAPLPAWPRWGRSPDVPSPSPEPRGLELDGERLAFHATRSAARERAAVVPAPDGASLPTLLRLDAPFGVTLLASPRRDRLIALLSSASGTFYLGAAFDVAARRAFAPILDRCFTVIGDDAGMEAIGPDGEPLVLSPDELASLLDALIEHSPSCLDRLVLTDARGASVTLDGRHLCIGDRTVDLSAPLEWKPIVFQEAFGQAIAVYQGTWIRQSSTELTLVSLLPALGPPPGEGLDLGSLDRAVLRDLRLMQATPEAPPPNEQRVAIDRLFMLPLRSALDRAPRASHQPNRALV
jgi:hypothetical protein